MLKESKLALKLGCSEALARAALARCDNSLQKAEELLTCGLQELQATYASCLSEFGSGHGDAIFTQRYIQCLQDVARQQVQEALDEQEGGTDERWLICVRTYGRARPITGLERMLHVIKESGAHQHTAHKLQQAGIDDISKLEVALQDPEDLQKRIGVKSKTLSYLREQISNPTPLARKRHEKGILQLTLAALSRTLGDDAPRRCLIFVSHEDKDFTSGRYAEALKGTPWEDRIVCGIKGAHLQVRFIEEVAPRGAHVVVADDNIEDFYAEVASDERIEREKQNGNMNYFRRCLDLGEPEDPLSGTGLQAVAETELLQFLRGSNRRAKIAVMQEVEERLKAAQMTVTSLKKVLRSDPQELNRTLRKAGVKALGKHLLDRMCHQLRMPLPPRIFLTTPSRGTPEVHNTSGSHQPELAQLINRAWQEMSSRGANLWGINPTQNHYFIHVAGTNMREKAKKKGIWKDHADSLGLVYGAFFGFKVQHERACYTRFGQVKDDVERTLRYWHRDKVILRFTRYAVLKTHKPGQFLATKGGISAGSTAELHEAEATRALKGIIDDFAWQYVRFPKPDETHCCGLVWRATEGEDDVVQPKLEADPTSDKSTSTSSGVVRKRPASALDGHIEDEEISEEREVTTKMRKQLQAAVARAALAAKISKRVATPMKGRHVAARYEKLD